jgi:protoporphyrinogen oxidase
MENKTLILGGGITGLSAASFLNDYLILEKESKVGGYCKTTLRNGFVWDYSGHFFHFRNPEIKNYILENIKCDLLNIDKITHIYYKGKLINYPFQYNIHQLSLEEFIECLYGVYQCKDIDTSSFKTYIKTILGEPISDKFIIPYNEKLYACDLNDLDYTAMGRFFPPSLNFSDLLLKIKENNKVTSYNDNFIYPTGGSFEFVKSILTRLNKDKIILNCEVKSIDLDKKIVFTNNGTYYFENLINTLPFNTFLKLTQYQTHSPLSSNKVAVFNLGFDKSTNIKSHWIYFPGDEIFYRVGFYNNILSQDRMSLYIEVSLNQHEKINKETLLENILEDLKKCDIITDQKLIDHEFLIMNPAYVHITKESNDLYKEWNDKYNPRGIYSIGRYGSWTYCSIEDNIIQAKETANIIQNK